MIRNLLLFLGTFGAGALLALLARAAWFDPHHDPAGSPVPVAEHASPAAAPTHPAEAPPGSAPEAAPHGSPGPGHAAAHPAPSSGAEVSSPVPVNTVCAICGMAVDPDLPTAQYRGQTIGFGCRACPARFAADPDRYGPSYLRNEVLQP